MVSDYKKEGEEKKGEEQIESQKASFLEQQEEVAPLNANAHRLLITMDGSFECEIFI